MSTFLITFGVFIAVIAAMSIGYIIQKKVVKGSCGGLGAVGIEKSVTAQNHAMRVKSERHVKLPVLKSSPLGKKIALRK